MGFRSNNPFEQELVKMLTTIERLKKDINQLMNTYKILPIKDKILMIQKIQVDFKSIKSFIQKAKQEKNMNTAVAFKLDNVKNKTMSLINLWRKVEFLVQT